MPSAGALQLQSRTRGYHVAAHAVHAMRFNSAVCRDTTSRANAVVERMRAVGDASVPPGMREMSGKRGNGSASVGSL